MLVVIPVVFVCLADPTDKDDPQSKKGKFPQCSQDLDNLTPMLVSAETPPVPLLRQKLHEMARLVCSFSKGRGHVCQSRGVLPSISKTNDCRWKYRVSTWSAGDSAHPAGLAGTVCLLGCLFISLQVVFVFFDYQRSCVCVLRSCL